MRTDITPDELVEFFDKIVPYEHGRKPPFGRTGLKNRRELVEKYVGHYHGTLEYRDDSDDLCGGFFEAESMSLITASKVKRIILYRVHCEHVILTYEILKAYSDLFETRNINIHYIAETGDYSDVTPGDPSDFFLDIQPDIKSA